MGSCEVGILQAQRPCFSIRIRTANIIWRKLLVYVTLAWSDSPETLSILQVGLTEPGGSMSAGL